MSAVRRCHSDDGVSPQREVPLTHLNESATDSSSVHCFYGDDDALHLRREPLVLSEKHAILANSLLVALPEDCCHGNGDTCGRHDYVVYTHGDVSGAQG